MSEYQPGSHSDEFEGLEEAYAQFMQETEIREQIEAQVYEFSEPEVDNEPDVTETPIENLSDEIPAVEETSLESQENLTVDSNSLEPDHENTFVEEQIETAILGSSFESEITEPSVIEKTEIIPDNTKLDILSATSSEIAEEEIIANGVENGVENKTIVVEPKENSLLGAVLAFVKKIPLWCLLFPISLILFFVIRRIIPHKTDENEIRDNTILDAFCNGAIDIDQEIQRGSLARDSFPAKIN